MNAGRAQAQTPAAPTFDVEAYDIDGNTVLDQRAVETAVYKYLGPGRTPADVEAARLALEAAYRARGYQSVVVEIPPQAVADRIVRVHVVEATVGRVRVTGARFYSIDAVRKGASALTEGEVPNLTQAQAQINELNRIPARQVTPVLHAGVIPGTVDVDLKVTDQAPWRGSLELSNDHSPDTKPLRLTATGHYDNLFQLGQSLTATYAVAPQSRTDSEVYAGSYLAPIWNTPWSLLVYGYNSNSNVATIGGATVLGKGHAIGARGLLQVPNIGDISQSLSMGADYKHFLENLTVSKSSVGSVVDYWPLNFVYSAQRQTDAATTRGSLGLTLGTRGAGSSEAELENKRAFARGNFVHVNLDLEQTQRLPAGFGLDVRLTAQLANQPLVSSEQFAAGGLTSVRGFLQSQAVGDNGVFGSLQLNGPSYAPDVLHLVDEVRPYVFADAADLVMLDSLPGQTSEFTLYSAGAGMHLQLLKHLSGELVLAVPLHRAREINSGDPYGFFDLKSDF